MDFRPVEVSDLPDCTRLETTSYPSDEAASGSTLQYRFEKAPSYFRVAILDGSLAGFICATRCHEFAEDSMTSHQEDGSILAIHSVVVQEGLRRKGIATEMLLDYVRSAKKSLSTPPQSIMLLAKAHLLGFYVKCGFKVLRPSKIEHGQEQWFDLEMKLQPECFIVDAFADPAHICTGNPAAVVPLQSPAESEWMQAVAKEFNLSETAFVWPKGDGTFVIRYFTPTVEVALCGHATLASAAVMFQQGMVESNVCFHAKEDVLRATCGSSSTEVSMTFPLKPVTKVEENAEPVRMICTALRIESADILFVGVSQGLGDLFVEVSPDCFTKLGYDQDLNIAAFLDCDAVYTRGVIVCCVGTEVDFVSRFFGPKAGIDEDPVTGSAHCALADYFGKKLGKTTMKAKQASSRGGRLSCEIDGSSVTMTGSAIIALEGTLRIPQ